MISRQRRRGDVVPGAAERLQPRDVDGDVGEAFRFVSSFVSFSFVSPRGITSSSLFASRRADPSPGGSGHERDGRAPRRRAPRQRRSGRRTRVRRRTRRASRLRLRLRHGRLDEPHARVQPELGTPSPGSRPVARGFPASCGPPPPPNEARGSARGARAPKSRGRRRGRRRASPLSPPKKKSLAPQALAERLRDHQRRLPGLEELLSRQHVLPSTPRARPPRTCRPRKTPASAGERRLRDALRNGVSDVGVFRDVHESRGARGRAKRRRASPAPAVAPSSSHARGTIARRSSSDASSQCSRSTAEAEPRASTIVAHLARVYRRRRHAGGAPLNAARPGRRLRRRGHAVVAGIMHPPHSCDSRTPPRAAGSGERRAPRRPVRAMMRLTRASNTFITTPTTFPSSSRPRFSSAPAPPPRTRTR